MRYAEAMILAVALMAQPASAKGKGTVKHLNPESLHKPYGYSHVVEVTGGRTLYVSGQVALDRAGALVGKGDLKAQTRQAFENLRAALAASGGSLDDLVKLTVFLTDVSEIQAFREARDAYLTKELPACSLVQVSRLARPDFLIEIEAVAVLE